MIEKPGAGYDKAFTAFQVLSYVLDELDQRKIQYQVWFEQSALTIRDIRTKQKMLKPGESLHLVLEIMTPDDEVEELRSKMQELISELNPDHIPPRDLLAETGNWLQVSKDSLVVRLELFFSD